MPNKIILGTVTAEFDWTGEPIKAEFSPDKQDYCQVIKHAPIRDEQEAVGYATLVLAAYFLHTDKVQERDPDISTLAQRVIACEKHPNGTPKHIEIEFSVN